MRSSAINRFAAMRDLPWQDLQFEGSWVSTDHESTRSTRFRGNDWNKRLSIRYGGGVEVADWRDEKELVAGIDSAIALRGAARLHVTRHLALSASVEKVYWTGIDLGELRCGIGIALTK
jgi:hypothetical protein